MSVVTTIRIVTTTTAIVVVTSEIVTLAILVKTFCTFSVSLPDAK